MQAHQRDVLRRKLADLQALSELDYDIEDDEVSFDPQKRLQLATALAEEMRDAKRHEEEEAGHAFVTLCVGDGAVQGKQDYLSKLFSCQSVFLTSSVVTQAPLCSFIHFSVCRPPRSLL